VIHDNETRALREGVVSGRYVRFGKPTAAMMRATPHDRLNSFRGWVDEITLWNRALTPGEVSHRFEAASASSER
jgi:hypothetical protein